MLNIAVKAATSRDSSGKPFLCAGKMQCGKKLVTESPKPMLIEILKLMLQKIKIIKSIVVHFLD
jgi:hypothetical protein